MECPSIGEATNIQRAQRAAQWQRYTPGVAKKTLVFGGEILRSKINFRIYLISVVLRPKQSLFSEIFSKIYKGDLKL